MSSLAAFRWRRPIACAALLGLATACAPRDPAPEPAQVLAAGAGLSWYRGNLHAHTLWSDGRDLPDAVVAWYRDHGYHFLALTEHDLMPMGERWTDVSRLPATDAAQARLRHFHPDGIDLRQVDGRTELRLRTHDELAARHDRPGAFVLLSGEEISDHVGPVSIHVNAINLPEAVPPARLDEPNRTIEADFTAARGVADAAGRDLLLQLNHPNFVHSLTAEHLMRVRGSPFFELYNGHPLSDNDADGLRPSVERMWDIALAWRLDVLGLPPLYATATDDSHDPRESGDAVPGRGWVMVLADTLQPGSLFEAMRKGRFYASSGVHLERIVATADRLEVEVAAEPGVEYLIEFIGTRSGFDPRSEPVASATGRPLYASRRYAGAIGEVLASRRGTHAVYRFGPDDLYVRARITSNRRHPAPSQPLQFEQAWVQPQPGPAAQPTRRPGLEVPGAADVALHLGVTRRLQPMPAHEVDALLRAQAQGQDCALDAITDGRGRRGDVFRAGDSVQVAGWIGDTARGEAADWLALVLHNPSGSFVGEGAPTRARPDVAQVFNKPALEASGYALGFELATTPPGDYRVWLIGYRDGRAGACDSGRSLRVE